jgi:colicin import membrane protein
VGSDGAFREHADLPTHLSDDEPKRGPKRSRGKPRKRRRRKIDDKAARKAALAFEREERRRGAERRREEAARQKQRERRRHAMSKAQAAFDKTKRSIITARRPLRPSAARSNGGTS